MVFLFLVVCVLCLWMPLLWPIWAFGWFALALVAARRG
jgi:hypothetical protein